MPAPPRTRIAASVRASLLRATRAFHALEFSADFSHTLVAQLPVFLQRRENDFFQLGRQVGIQFARRDRLLIEERIEDHGGGVPVERSAAGCHLV
jgi:hypothetical protein